MVEQAPREYLRKVFELSQERARLARVDPRHEMALGCRSVFGALLEYRYTLEKVAEKELEGHLPPVTRPARPLRVRGRGHRCSEGKLPKVDREPGEGKRILCVDESPDFVSFRKLHHA